MEIVKYNVNEAAISKMSDIYMNLAIKDLEDQEGYDAVHTSRMVMVKHRTAVDKLRKSANETSQEVIKNNNANAKKLIDLMEPIETHLKIEEDKITKEKERIKAREEAKEKAKIETRVSELFALGVNVPFFDLAMLSDDEYAEKFRSAKMTYGAEQLRIAEEKKRLETERLELERLRKKEEADQKAESERLEMLAKGQAIEADRLAKIQADIDAKEKALKNEQDKLEAEKKAEQSRKDLEILEAKLTEKARVKAEQNEIERVAHEAKELKKKEEARIAEIERQELLKPDKAKLEDYANDLMMLKRPTLSNDGAIGILEWTISELKDLSERIKMQAEGL